VEEAQGLQEQATLRENDSPGKLEFKITTDDGDRELMKLLVKKNQCLAARLSICVVIDINGQSTEVAASDS
jgi:hypothetical protein